METSLRLGLSRMAAQLCRRLVDATDVRPHGLALRAPGYDKVAVVGPRALQVVDHQVSSVRLDRRFKTLHRRQQVHERFGILGARHRDTAAPQPGRHLGRRRRTLLEFLVLVHADAPPASVFRELVVRITIQPPLPRLLRGDHRMTGGAGVLGGMLVGRAVAAQRGAALLARSQVDPVRADLHALGALPALGVPHGRDRTEVSAAIVGHRGLAYSCNTWWMAAMAIDPSPTAEAARLTLPLRTSPTANTPGRLVSSRWGGRASGQCAAARTSGERSGPVLMNPRASSATQPWSQAVLGLAPVIENTCRMLCVSSRSD